MTFCLTKCVIVFLDRGAKKKVKKILDSSTESSTSGTDEESLSSCSSSESSDSNIPRKRKRGHKKKTKSATRSNKKHSSRGKRMFCFWISSFCWCIFIPYNTLHILVISLPDYNWYWYRPWKNQLTPSFDVFPILLEH